MNPEWEKFQLPASLFKNQVLTHSGLVEGMYETHSSEHSAAQNMNGDGVRQSQDSSPVTKIAVNKVKLEEIREEALSPQQVNDVSKKFITKDSESVESLIDENDLFKVPNALQSNGSRLISPVDKYNKSMKDMRQELAYKDAAITQLQKENEVQALTIAQYKKNLNVVNIKLHEESLQAQYVQQILQEEVDCLKEELQKLQSVQKPENACKMCDKQHLESYQKFQIQVQNLLGETQLTLEQTFDKVIHMLKVQHKKYQQNSVNKNSQISLLHKENKMLQEQIEQIKIQNQQASQEILLLNDQILQLTKENLKLKTDNQRFDKLEEQLQQITQINDNVKEIKQKLQQQQKQASPQTLEDKDSNSIQKLKSKLSLLESQRQFQMKVNQLIVSSPKIFERTRNFDEFLNKQINVHKHKNSTSDSKLADKRFYLSRPTSPMKEHDSIPSFGSPAHKNNMSDNFDSNYKKMKMQEKQKSYIQRFDHSISNSQKLLKHLDGRLSLDGKSRIISQYKM